MKWLFRSGICMAVALVLFMVPGRLEGPVLVAISPGWARLGAFGAGLGLGLLLASVFTFFWWWAIGAGLLTATMLTAVPLVAATERS